MPSAAQFEQTMRRVRAGIRVWPPVAAIALASCSGDSSVSAPESELPTFVSLNPCLDAILVEVADPAQILALSHYSRDPASSSVPAKVAARFAITGGTAEEVLALQPDIVLASSFIAPSTRGALEQLGLRVETFGSPASIADSLDQIGRLGELTGDGSKAQDLAQSIERIQGPLDTAREISVLLWQPGQIVPGEGTLITELLRKNRFSSHSEALGLAQADYVSLERILADPPEVLLIAGDSAGQRHPMLDRLTDTRVESFDPRLLYCGGPTIIEANARIAAIREAAL